MRPRGSASGAAPLPWIVLGARIGRGVGAVPPGVGPGIVGVDGGRGAGVSGALVGFGVTPGGGVTVGASYGGATTSRASISGI